MGGEYQSYTFSQITELGITLINLPPLRPELKSIVERSFQLIQTSMKPALFDYGFVDKDYGKRLAKDSRKEAVLTLREYEKCVIYGLDSFEYKRRKQQELETAVSEKKAAVENLEDRQ